jgi:hypothetical protein
VEIPWVASKLWTYNHKPTKILDAGCAFYKLGITRNNFLPQDEICLMTLDKKDMNFDIPGCRTDKSVRDFRDPLPRQSMYDAVICISTLEHVGMDNTQHYTSDSAYQESSKTDYQRAIANLLACTSLGGKLLMTMPYGKAFDHKWLQVFDQDMVQCAERICHGNLISIEYFRHTYHHGWIRSNSYDASNCIYNDIHNRDTFNPDIRVAAAEAVVCIEVTKCKG